MRIINAKDQNIPYSFSRWTDVSASQNKWDWFMACMAQGHMIAFDPRSGIPGHWSLKPEETFGMVWWTKNPTNLLKEKAMFDGHRLKVHLTITGWEEVEKGAPKTEDAAELACRTAEVFGVENTIWRFSPVPLVEDAVARFEKIAKIVSSGGIKKTYLSFLQTNDLVAETRSKEDRLTLLLEFSRIAEPLGLQVYLCNEDTLLHRVNGMPANLSAGVCQPPEDFDLAGYSRGPSEGCGCILMADPFTINESCSLGCTYCYASDKELSSKKRNTTKGVVLPVIR